jgi:AcrR family transcriptional regulator
MPASAGKRKGRPESATYSRFLDAAEALFVDHGYEGTKIRAIAEKAGANLGALHHYWGSKKALFRAVCERRLVPINEERQRRMRACVAEAKPGEPVDIRALVAALVEPVFFVEGETKRERTLFHRFYGRALTEPSTDVEAVMAEIFRSTTLQFLSLLRQACPHLSDEDFYWRINSVFGAFTFSPAFLSRVMPYAGKSFPRDDLKRGAAETIEFLVAGMLTPSSARLVRRGRGS